MPDRAGVVGGLAAVAVVCCAGLPLLASIAAGIGTGAVLGIGAGGLVTGTLLVGVVLVRRRRCDVRDNQKGLLR